MSATQSTARVGHGRRPQRVAWLCVSLLVVAMRMAGAHAHVCVDGLDPPQTLHWQDADVVAGSTHLVSPHDGCDLCISSDASCGKPSVEADAQAVIQSWPEVAEPVAIGARMASSAATGQASCWRRYLLPPLRAPPR